MSLSGAVNGNVFAHYLDQVLNPTLRLGDVVVLDNLPIHKVNGLAAVVETRGASLLCLPPYSPDFSPIGLTFKRQAQARTHGVLEEAI